MRKSEKRNTKIGLTPFLSGVAALAGFGTLQAAERPNVLWLFSDDHAYQAIGAYGGRFAPLNPTPNIDSLARDGMRFDRCYVANSICGPSRATLLTGKHSHLNGKTGNNDPFDHSQPQFQMVLQKQGYQTALLGKIHLDGKPQGFDYWEVLPGQGQYENPVFITETGKKTYTGHESDVVTDLALGWLDRREAQKPFMLMVHYKAPHRNWIPAERFREKFSTQTFPEPDTLFDDYSGRGAAAHKQDMNILKTMQVGKDLKADIWPKRKACLEEPGLTDEELVRRKYQAYMQDYFACVAGVDENVGRLLTYLKDHGLDQNTVVMYSSDQGFYLGEHGWFDKRFMYEESFRTPLLARWPGVVKPGSVNIDLAQNIDFAETFLDIAGASIPDDMQGRSLVPLLKGATPSDWRSSLYYHYYDYPSIHSVRRHEGVVTQRYKLIRFYGMDVPNGEEWEFYDLEKDPQEMTSLYASPEMVPVIAGLKNELKKLRTQYRVPDVPPPQTRLP